MRSIHTIVIAVALLVAGCAEQEKKPSQPTAQAPATKPAAPATKPVQDPDGWKPLFDGKTLTGWEKSDYVASPDPVVKDGVIVLKMGEILTGITCTKNLPKTNYEVTLEAMRADGHDFFCGLTFPFNDRHATLVCSGWGGSVTGISSIDGRDASENETTRGITYDDKKWYSIRLRVEPSRIRAWT